MALYFLMGSLSVEGQRMLHRNPELILEVSRDINVPGAQILGQYAVLGRYDFITMVQADDNQAVGEVSLELGVRAGLRIETLPAIPMGFAEERDSSNPSLEDTGAAVRMDNGGQGTRDDA